jgi:hypothetical protein
MFFRTLSGLPPDNLDRIGPDSAIRLGSHAAGECPDFRHVFDRTKAADGFRDRIKIFFSHQLAYKQMGSAA